MFELPVLAGLDHGRERVRANGSREAVATFGLLLTIFGCAARTPASGSVCGRPLHHGGLLVHRLDLVRQSRGDPRAFAFGYFRRHRPSRRAGLHRRPACRHLRGRRLGAVAVAVCKVHDRCDETVTWQRLSALPLQDMQKFVGLVS